MFWYLTWSNIVSSQQFLSWKLCFSSTNNQLSSNTSHSTTSMVYLIQWYHIAHWPCYAQWLCSTCCILWEDGNDTTHICCHTQRQLSSWSQRCPRHRSATTPLTTSEKTISPAFILSTQMLGVVQLQLRWDLKQFVLELSWHFMNWKIVHLLNFQGLKTLFC